MTSRYVIGIDIGGTKLLAGLADEKLHVHRRLQRSMLGLDTASLLDTMQQVTEELINSSDGEVSAVGFGIPSLIDRRTGTSVLAVHLPLAGVRFEALMSEHLQVPVFVDNDGNCAMLAEHRAGAAQGADHAVLVALGTGIAGGMIINGSLYRGAIGAGAEFGHMVIDIDGPPCHGNCPNHGCFEVLCSGTALAREAQRIASAYPESELALVRDSGRELDGALVTELAHDGDPAAGDVIGLIGERLGVGIANLVNIFNPEVVVVGGGVMAAGEMLMEPARATVAERALPPARDLVRILPAQFGSEAGMVGAAALAWSELEGVGRSR
jgi:glucokinase